MGVALDHLLVAATGAEASRQTVDREKVLAILRKRFPGSTSDQLAAAANALVGLKDEWREVAGFHSVEGRRFKLFEYLGD
jgi:hypothetical protein